MLLANASKTEKFEHVQIGLTLLPCQEAKFWPAEKGITGDFAYTRESATRSLLDSSPANCVLCLPPSDSAPIIFCDLGAFATLSERRPLANCLDSQPALHSIGLLSLST